MVAKKYNLDVTRIKEYLSGGPDPDANQSVVKLTKASELR